MSFDYNLTCPDIDKNIDGIRSDITSSLDSLLDECCPELGEAEKKEMIEYRTNEIYNDFEGYFEKVRDTNVKMREEADKQTEKLEKDLEQIKEELKEAEEELEEMRHEISKLEYEIEEMNEELNRNQ